MKNVISVFKSDLARISKNVIALIIIIGVCVIPCLYAWFNILSNWDPYGADATSNLHIAVVSKDKGKELLGVSLDVGDKLITQLQANKDVGWVFPETEEAALEGVNSGDYYAAMIVPEDFSEDMMSFLSGKPEDPQIDFYANAKKNSIATKITSKAKTTIQRKINEAFVETVTLYSSEAADSILGDEEMTSQVVDTLMGRLDSLDQKLDTFVSVIDTFVLLNESTYGLLQTADTVIPETGELISSSLGAVEVMKATSDTGVNTAQAITQMGDAALDRLTSGMDTLHAQAALISSGVDVSTITGLSDTILNSEAFKAVDRMIELLEDTPIELLDAYQNAVDSHNDLVERLQNIGITAESAKETADSLSSSLQADVSAAKDDLTALKADFDDLISPRLIGVASDASDALSEAAAILGNIDTDFTELTDTLDAYKTTLDKGTQSLNDTKEYVLQTKEDLEALKGRINGLSSSEAYKKLMVMLDEDLISLADFVSSPVVLDEKVFYDIPNFGSEMAPFYTILGIWVGSLFLIALLKVAVLEEEENKEFKAWQKFFGRYLTFFFIGLIQALLTCLGNLFFVGIYCVHPVLFVITGLIASFVFTLFMYSLTVAFRAVGQAIVVVILVIQVAGSGGTFPIEMLPAVYQAVYRFLPFNYAINAMRECVGGMYGSDHLVDIGKLLIFAAVGVVIGLVMMKPFSRLREAVDRSKKDSGIML